MQRFTVSFYLTAMLFIVFDIEIVFLYPLAVILHQLAWFGFLEFLFFIAILVIAVRLRLAEGCARLAIEDGKKLRDYGLQSERAALADEGPGRVRAGGRGDRSRPSG